jgi:CO/xanthine dehydrogenase Mo-binding subunit
VQRACVDARGKIATMAAEVFGGQAADYEPAPGGVRGPDGPVVGFGEVIVRWFGANAGEVTGIGLVRRDGATQKMPPFWEVGMVGVEVGVDEETGVVEVEQLVTVADVGFAINPKAVEGQDLGAATQGLGGALYEELVYDGPQLLNPNIVEYRVPRIGDMPRKIDTMIAERHDGVGPYGAKGAGEGALNPMAAAVASAVARATGHWPTQLPLTPERVWRMLNGLPPNA